MAPDKIRLFQIQHCLQWNLREAHKATFSSLSHFTLQSRKKRMEHQVPPNPCSKLHPPFLTHRTVSAPGTLGLSRHSSLIRTVDSYSLRDYQTNLVGKISLLTLNATRNSSFPEPHGDSYPQTDL